MEIFFSSGFIREDDDLSGLAKEEGPQIELCNSNLI